MTQYSPDCWVVIRVSGDNTHYRVLAGWSGGYTSGDSWKLNSGITHVTEGDNHYHFHGSSGSCYSCHKEAYGLRLSTIHIWNQLEDKYKEKVTMLPESSDWLDKDWNT